MVELDERELLIGMRNLLTLAEDGIQYRKDRNNNIQCVTASAQAHRLAMEFIKERGLEEEFRKYVEKQ